jgi:hypothetical protein
MPGVNKYDEKNCRSAMGSVLSSRSSKRLLR